jgi:hypothetical protein
MRNVIKNLTLALALTVASPALVAAPTAFAKPAASLKVDWKKTEDHLRNHQSYPATRAELLASCKDLMDFSDAEKKWFADHLPEGSYKSADDVLKALGKK